MQADNLVWQTNPTMTKFNEYVLSDIKITSLSNRIIPNKFIFEIYWIFLIRVLRGYICVWIAISLRKFE